MSSGGHYTKDELKNFFSPNFAVDHGDEEIKMIEHLKSCKACSVLAKNIHERDWQEIRESTAGFG